MKLILAMKHTVIPFPSIPFAIGYKHEQVVFAALGFLGKSGHFPNCNV